MRNCCRRAAAGLGLALCTVLSACVSMPPGEGGLTRLEQAELQRRERRLDDSPQRVRDARLNAYLQRLLARLSAGAQPLRIHVVARPEPQADLLGGKIIVLRTGLLAQAVDEDELAFVLAHELAHRDLAHVTARRRADWNARSAELAADRVAAQTLQRLGYRGGAGPDLLRRLLASTGDPGARALIEARIDALPAVEAAATTDPEFESATARYRTIGRARSTD